jgi:hypothetical protein
MIAGLHEVDMLLYDSQMKSATCRSEDGCTTYIMSFPHYQTASTAMHMQIRPIRIQDTAVPVDRDHLFPRRATTYFIVNVPVSDARMGVSSHVRLALRGCNPRPGRPIAHA